MPHRQRKVAFQPSGRTVYVLPGTTLVEAAGRAGITLQMPCGGGGTCGKCRVRITDGCPEPVGAETATFDAAEIADGWRLACQAQVARDMTVEVPAASVFAAQQQILTEAATAADATVVPTLGKHYLTMSAPTLSDGAADLERLEEAVGTPLRIGLPLLRLLPGRLRRQSFTGTAVMLDGALIDFETGDTAAACYGVAFDIGTTTMVGELLDMRSGEPLAVESRMNPQVSFGDDVLARINFAGAANGNLEKLHHEVVNELGAMITALCTTARIEPHRIYAATFAGNTTMEHLLCCLDPSQLGQIPFVPAFGRGLQLSADALTLPIHPRGLAYVFPVLGGFVGGDTVAGMLATRLDEADAPVLMVDIGTNGEIVLARNGKLWASSTAAGPAFEGARISCGMRATRGAIEKVLIDGDCEFSVIGDVMPTGLCGSGLIDLVAQLLEVGVINELGRLLPPDEQPPSIPPAIARRVEIDADGNSRFVLSAYAGIAITQRDIRELQLSSGAIRAGITILLKQAGLTTADLDQVLIAGGFGSFIRRNHAQRIGLLPSDIDHQRIRYVGNISHAGAKWALLCRQARQRAERIARTAVHVELSTDPAFQVEFADAMIFPT